MNRQDKLLQEIEKGFEDKGIFEESTTTFAQAPEPLTEEKLKVAIKLMREAAKIKEEEQLKDYLTRMNFGVNRTSPFSFAIRVMS